ncbi:MAG: DUF3303 domain-containing protein [Promethearchaeota archaeon]
MKFLIEWYRDPEHLQTVTKLLEKWKQPKDWKVPFPAHYCAASSRGFFVLEVDSAETIQKGLEPFLDYVDFVVTPILPLFTED